ncbi:UTRA domain-containing protein, partial [Streptomyces gamaensis]
KHHGRGNFIRRPDERIRYDNQRLFSPHPAPAEAELHVHVSVHRVAAVGTLPALLQVRDGAPLTEYVYTSHRNDITQSLAYVYVPRAVARLGTPTGNLSPWGDDIRTLLANAGVHVVSTRERLTTRLPSSDDVRLLRTTTPVLVIERTSIDTTGRVAEGALLVLPGDRTEAVFTTFTPAVALEVAE